MSGKYFSPGEALSGTTLFYDAGSHAAVLVQRKGNKDQEREKRFLTPQTALEWCIARRHHFVYLAIPAGGVSDN